MEEIYITFTDDEGFDLWEEVGAKVDRSRQYVWPDRHLVLEWVAKAPKSFTWRARNPVQTLFDL